MALVGLKDPLRSNVRDSVGYATQYCDINVRMVSGDNLDTAKAVACDAGILTKEEYDNPNPEEQRKIALDA